ncbi:TRRAP-like protein [Mya arenaria]|uniref:TRRAP-like protein n=1 Tax=Mya arenaria TaxID=6604 RepID=A0ABY7DE61_MYAAR|nr:TRRAP-like protein [Mya arenaria]
MWAGLWQKRAKFSETNTAIAYEQHGFFEQAQGSYEAVNVLNDEVLYTQAMARGRADHNTGPASPPVLPEYRLWEDHWIRYMYFHFNNLPGVQIYNTQTLNGFKEENNLIINGKSN